MILTLITTAKTKNRWSGDVKFGMNDSFTKNELTFMFQSGGPQDCNLLAVQRFMVTKLLSGNP